MAGCGRLAAGVRTPDSHPDGSGGTVRGPGAGSVAARRQRRGVHGGRTSTAPHVAQPEPSAPMCLRRPVNPPGRRIPWREASAAAQPLHMAVVRHGVRTPTGDAVRVEDTCCPQHGSGPVASAGRTTSGMTFEAAAEGPQRFRPGGGNGTGCRTPDRSRAASCLDTPSAHRTTWPHTGQDAASSGRSIR
jgi:hypothetical protein